jgi:hypothetical protein
MSKDLKRRIEKLERQVGVSGFETKLRAVVRRWGGNEEAYLRAARGHERKLGPALGEDGSITWEGFQLLRDLLHPSRHASRAAGRKGAPAEPGLKSPLAGSEPRKFKFISHFENRGSG